MIYLDYAAATPVDSQVVTAMRPYWQEQFYNPSATYLAGQTVAKSLAAARGVVAAKLGARPNEIVFTAGGTEADNLAINGVMQQFPKAKLLVSAIEHHAVLNVAKNYRHDIIPVTASGLIQLERLAQQIDDQTVLISVMYANNEVGTIQPLRQVKQLIKTELLRRKKDNNDLPLYLHTDASQAANYLDLQVNRLGVDLMTLNGGKIYGPKQTGGLFVKAGIVLRPQIVGGGQERGLRSGTENIAGAIGFARAIEIAQEDRTDESERLKELQQSFIDQLKKAFPRVLINGAKQRLPNNVHVTIPGIDNERVMMQLDEAGIMCAVGSACSASNDEPSHVLRAMAISDQDAQSSLRFTMGRQTTLKDVNKTIQTLQKLVA